MSRCLLAFLLTACGPRVVEPLPEAESEADTTGIETTTSTTSPLPSTSGPSPTTASPTTIDPSTSTGDGSSSDEVGGFIRDPDGSVCGPPPPEGTSYHCSWCNTWDQDCPRGEKCLPWANDGTPWWNATRCSPLDPDSAGPGEPCMVEDSPASGVDDCDIGSMCWGVDPDMLDGECAAFCEGSENNPICSVPGTECVITNEGTLSLCLPSCDPLSPVPCDSGESCHPIDARWACLPDGAAVRNGDLTPTLCEPSTTAVDPTTLSTCDPKTELCCAEICDVATPDCSAPAQCVAVGDTGNAGLCVD